MEPTFVKITAPIAPSLESCNGDYEVYCQAYNSYLRIATEYNKAVKMKTEQSSTIQQAALPSVKVTFAQQDSRQSVGNITVPDPFKYQDKESRNVKTRFSGVASRTPTFNSVINMIEHRDQREAISERLDYLASTYPKIDGHKPTIQEISSGLRDVLTPGAIDDLITRKRVPKSYRSLANLREMGLRVKSVSPKVLLDAGDLTCLN